MRTNKNRYKKKIKRECWNLDRSFYSWMLEHLKAYLSTAGKVIDLSEYTFTVDEVTLTQDEAIKFLIQLLERIEYIHDNFYEVSLVKSPREIAEEETQTRKLAMAWWAEILPCMWW